MILIVEKDAGEVIVPVAEGLAEETLVEGVLVEILLVVVPIGNVLVPVGGIAMMTVPLVGALGAVGLITEGPVPEKRLGEVAMVTESLVEDIVDEEPIKKRLLGAVAVDESSGEDLERRMPLTKELVALAVAGNDPLVMEGLIGMPFEFTLCCL